MGPSTPRIAAIFRGEGVTEREGEVSPDDKVNLQSRERGDIVRYLTQSSVNAQGPLLRPGELHARDVLPTVRAFRKSAQPFASTIYWVSPSSSARAQNHLAEVVREKNKQDTRLLWELGAQLKHGPFLLGGTAVYVPPPPPRRLHQPRYDYGAHSGGKISSLITESIADE